jgi:sulfate/thiosulfate transport system substrate-binding protein
MKSAARLLAMGALIASLGLGFVITVPATVQAQERKLINASYDPTRELYREFNDAFRAHWQGEKGEDIQIQVTHGGSGSQARAVIDGLEADVVTLALESDINAISDAGLIAPNWRSRLENNSSPYTSTIVFLVRKGNPKGIEDWGDLTKQGVEVITPNPKTSGGARWNFLAAWAWAKAQEDGSDETAQAFVTELYRHVPVLDSGARGSTTTFVQRQVGDVLLAWENEAYLALEELGPDAFDIVTPSISILAEPPVAVVDANVDRKGTRELAEAYLQYLYSPEGQAIAARNFYRPSQPEHAAAEDIARFGELQLATIEDFGGWREAQPRFFANGGIFDQIFMPAGQ